MCKSILCSNVNKFTLILIFYFTLDIKWQHLKREQIEETVLYIKLNEFFLLSLWKGVIFLSKAIGIYFKT